MTPERRLLQGANFRYVAGQDGSPDEVHFTPIVMGVRSNNVGFNEEIELDAFDNADMSDIRALFNHDPNFVMGRSTNNTLRWVRNGNQIDAIVTLPEHFPAYQREMIQRGDVTGASFGFRVDLTDPDSYEFKRDNGKIYGKLKRAAEVFDMSIVTFPFYKQTEGSVQMSDGLRSLFEAQENIQEVTPQEESIKKVSPEIRLIQLENNTY